MLSQLTGYPAGVAENGGSPRRPSRKPESDSKKSREDKQKCEVDYIENLEQGNADAKKGNLSRLHG